MSGFYIKLIKESPPLIPPQRGGNNNILASK